MNIELLKKMLSFNSDTNITEVINSIIIYLRKSRKDSDYFKDEPIEKTLERHEKQLQDWAINTLGIKIPESNIYREVASGDTIEDRPVMQEVLTKIEDSNIRAVLCIEIERLARGNTIDQGIIAQAFKYSNTKIITPYKTYDLDNEDDSVYFEDGLYQSRKYLLYTKRILKRGRIRSVQDGKYICSVSPYGYNKKKLVGEKGFTLEFNEEQYKIVNLIANLFAYGIDTTYKIKEDDTISSIAKIYSMTKSELVSLNPNSKFVPNDILTIRADMGTSAIANYLNYINIAPKKASNWSPSMIKNILQSPTIYGYVTWGARETVKTMENGQFVKRRPRNKNCMYIKGNFEPILNIDDERTKLIINKLENNKTSRVPSEYEIKNPLSGLIVCPICGKNMIRRPFSNHSHVDTLYCKTARCPTVGSNLYLVEERLLHSLGDILTQYSLYISQYDLEYKKEIDNSNNLNSIIEDELKKANAKLEKCYDLLEDGTYTKELFNKRVDKLKLEIAKLEEKKKENSNIDFVKKYEERKKAIPLLQKALESYDKCDTIKDKNDMLNSIVKTVIYEKTRGGRGYEEKFDLKIKLKI